ncbi:PIN domain-containing protein [Microbacterium sp.]|uniref:PIN domain-containing protein n=1 Tax=Microbacterium sp. TaxID=51671 RepID=UPI003A92AB0A
MTSADGGAHPTIRVVLADANVLYSRVLRDYLLYVAAEGVFEIRWSASILSEVIEHLSENVTGFDLAAGARLVAAMNGAFPAAQVEVGRDAETAVAGLALPDEDDRHVLAAAVAVDADVLCTDNLKDFPIAAMDEVGIQLMSADALLSLIATEFPAELRVAHRLTVSRLSGATDASTLAALRRAGGTRTADLMARILDT